MTKKNNQNKQSGQLARQSQKSSSFAQGQGAGFAPVASARAMQSREPSINTGKKMTRVVHRELVSTISGNTTFGVDSFSLNPGLSATFPWLSTIAGSYEQYRFNRLSFHYVTRAPTSYIGSILMAPEYDPLDAAPSSEVLASMMNGAIEDSPWKNQSLTFNVADMFPMGPRKYIRTGTLPTSSDIKTYDAGQLFVCEVTCTDTSAIGKLWVDYDVEFHIPQNPGATSLYNVGSAAMYNIITSAQSLATGVAEDVVWNNELFNGIGASNASGVITLPAGTYIASGYVAGASSTGTSMQIELIPYVDNVALSEYKSYLQVILGSNSFESPVPFQFPIELSASGTVKLTVEMTAAGTLTVPLLNNSLSILRVA